MRKTKEEAAKTRKTILSSSIKLFLEKGYFETSLENIATEAGVTRGAIYWNFKNKHDIYKTIFEEVFLDDLEELENIVDDSLNPYENLRNFMFNHLISLERNEEIRMLSEIARFKVEVKGNENTLNGGLKIQQNYDQQVKKIIEDILKKGMNESFFKQGIKIEDISLAVLCFLNGIEDTWLLDPKSFSLEGKLYPLIDIFLKGILEDEKK